MVLYTPLVDTPVVYTQAVDPAGIYNDSRYHSCFIFLFVDILYTTSDYYQYILLVTTIGDYDQYIPFLSTTGAITGIYHGCLLPVHTTGGILPVIITHIYYC